MTIDESGAHIEAAAVVIAILSLVVSLWSFAHQREGARNARVQATLEFWTQSQERRFKLRENLPYESERQPLANFIASLRTGSPEEHAVQQYLSLFETLAGGVLHGAFDFDTAKSLDGPRIREIWVGYQPWITARREKYQKSEIYKDLETLAAKLDRDKDRPRSRRRK